MTGRNVRLLIRGGSISAGSGAAWSYVQILEEFGRAHGIEVVNRSRAGENSFDAVSTFREDIEALAPDLLVLHFGVDDAFFPVYRSEFKENLVRVVRLARRMAKPPVVLLPTSHLWDAPFEMEALGIYYRAIREVAVDLDCVLVPVHTFWAGRVAESGLAPSALVQEDARLPSDEGHALIAEALLETLKTVLPYPGRA